MKALKWIGIGVGALAVLVGAIVALVFSLTGGAANAANEFLALVGKGRYQAAYRATAPQFRAQQDLGAFRSMMQRFGIDKFESASWPSREIGGGRTTLKGAIRTRGGGRVPATIIVVQVNDAWKVYALDLRRAGATTGGARQRSGPPLPDAATVRRLIKQSLLDFNEAVQDRDFRAFHGTLARLMQNEYSARQLRKTFQPFIDAGINLVAIRAFEPVFTKGPAISGSGILKVAGYYPTRPSRLSFELSYMRDRGRWRVVAINVRVKPQK